MLNKLKAFINKNDYNYSEGFVDPFKFHKTFYKMLVAFKVADIENEYKRTWFDQNSILFILGLYGVIQSAISTHHGFDNFEIPFMTEAGSYLIIMSYKMLILSCTKLNIPQYHSLLRALKDDFVYICSEGAKYRERYFKIQVVIWKICIFSCCFLTIMGSGIIIFGIFTLIYFLITHKPGDDGARPLVFPFWLPHIDFGKTPYYEIAFIYSNACTIGHIYAHIFVIQTEILWIYQIGAKCDIIAWNIEDVLDGVTVATNQEEEEYFSSLIHIRMKKIIMRHQDMLSLLQDYAVVFKKLLMFEEKCFWPLICLTAYVTVEKLEEREFHAVLTIVCIAAIVLYFIPCYLCTFLAKKVSSISDACWSIPFWNRPMIRPYLVLLMQRAQQPLPLHVPGFDCFSLETFCKKMSSAYSLFNMLRQINKK